MHLEKHVPGLNIIIYEYMSYKAPSLKKWVGGREGRITGEALLNKEGLCKTEWIIWRRRACYEHYDR